MSFHALSLTITIAISTLYHVNCAALFGSDAFGLSVEQPMPCSQYPCKVTDAAAFSSNKTLIGARYAFLQTLRHRGHGSIRYDIVPPHGNFLIFLNGKEPLTYYLVISDVSATFNHPNFTQSITRVPKVSLTQSRDPWLSIWVSVSAREPAFIKLGYGYPMDANTLFTFTPDRKKVPKNYAVDAFLSELESSYIAGVELVRQAVVTSEPIVLDPSPKLILPEQRRREHEMLSNGQFYLPVANLPFTARGLMEEVNKFELTEKEMLALQYSVQTPGNFLFNVLQNKKKPGLKGYLRADFRTARRTTPGQDLVLEVVIPGGSSPIHDHGNASAVIKYCAGDLLLSITIQ
ncbi:uncharacterized protein LOC129594042 [Paramacrobiotus metropolitanus]|uniref:uncharacterized protein LOC129594042 n=1 Tax=Paramacrobiotus metropolitanus TaxID=2943436 RepID=UPI002445CA58|nr:uncharacterized protein LOC129594042 [Paramacrobiotus metropolitanus]